MSKADPVKVAKKFLAQKDLTWLEQCLAPYPRPLTRHLPNEIDVVWWRAGKLYEGDIEKFIGEHDPDSFNGEPGYRVSSNQRVRAAKVYLR